MEFISANGQAVAVIGKSRKIDNVQTALDLMAEARYLGDSEAMVVYKESLTEAFFDLKTRFAGDVLQKFSNYRFKLAIVGDFSAYNSKALRDFIRESNRGHDIFFVTTEGEALQRLSAASAD
jgi:hypothetical protein